ncbi:KilA-N domain-containing protein [uncultured Sneathia sp.]|uniref:KilA-N domain-containing protein n=1 Tax=uncultured Sneathia sp. TaxID=278067 RepID=UPI00338D544F
MSKVKKDTIEAKGFAIQIYTEDFKNDYISLTDIARYKNVHEPKDVVKNWLRVRDTIEFLGLWETIHNPNFKGVEFDSFRKEAGTNAFTLSPQRWIEKTNAIGIVSKSGRGGGTFAHSDIAMEFASWISPEFKLYIIQDYKRLKSDENSKLSLGWNLNREISKINYKIHTDAIKEYLLKDLTNEQLSYKYASEADMLNVALFNKRAKQWREENPDLNGNMRDYASLNELLVLANMESYNAVLIGKGADQKERMIELRKLARTQLMSLEKLSDSGIKKLERNNIR